MLDAVKREPCKYSYGSAGSGSEPHLAMELLKREAGIEMQHVPFNGGGPALTAAMAGDVQVMFDSMDTGLRAGDSGKVRALGISSEQRSAAAPQLPTIAEACVRIDGSEPRAAVEQVARARALGLRGFAFDNGFCNLHQDDPSLWPVYDAIAREGMPLALTASLLLGPDMSYAHPERVRTVAKRYPELPVVVCHACYPWSTLACAVAYECPNVYLLPDCYLNTNAPGSRDYVDAANHFMADRLLYGSAYPVRPIGQSLRNFQALPLTQPALEGALWRNAQRLLDWPVG